MVNSLYVSPDGLFVITGDSKGWIKTWDVRTGTCMEELSRLNDTGHHAISHLHVSPPPINGREGDEDGRFLAANSYDNILRVYDRRSKLIGSVHGQDPIQLSFFVTGHKNKNWPIKSSFFRGEGNKYKLALPSARVLQRKLTEEDGEEFQET
jgi:COMPASS component SWD3